MRIGLDATFLAAEGRYTGMGVYTHGLVTGFAAVAQEHEVILLGYGPRPSEVPPGMSWHRLTPLPAGRLSPWLSHQVALPHAARHLNLDVLHVPGVNIRLSRPGIPFLVPCPLVVTLHDVIPLMYYGQAGPALPWRLRVAYRLALQAVQRAAVVVTVSETSRRDILAHLPIPADRVRTVHNGVTFAAHASDPDADRAHRAQLGLPPTYLLYAGSYEPRKNVVGTVQGYAAALSRRPLPPLVLLVERESGHRTAALQAIERSGVGNHLRWLHSLDDEDLAALYRGASLFLYPSFYEGFGFTPLQALSCGVPVVAADTGALPEVLGDAARYVDPSSVTAMADAIVRLFDHPEDAATLSRRGPVQAARFRWDRAAALTVAAYRQAIGSRARVLLPEAT